MKQCSNCGYNNDAEIDTEARCARCNFDGKVPESLPDNGEISDNLQGDEPFLIKQTVIVGQMQRGTAPLVEEAATEQPVTNAAAEKEAEAEVA